MREKNSTYLYIGNVTNEFTASNQDVDYTTLPVGSLALINADGVPVSEEDLITAVPTQKYCIVAKTAQGEIRKSPVFSSADVVSANLVNYFAPREQVSFIGYDGTDVTGFDTTFVVGDSYRILYDLKHSQSVCNTTADLITAPYYALGTTQAAAAKTLMGSTINVFKKRGINPIIVDRVALTTSVKALGGSGTVAKLTKGSKTVYAYIKATAANTTLTADDFTVTAGDVISIPSYNGRTFTFDCLDAVGHTCHIGTAAVYIADANTKADGSDNAAALAAAINLSTNAISAFASASAVGATVTVTYKEGFYALPPMVFSGVAAAPARVAVTIATGDTVSVKYVAAATTSEDATFELDEPWQGETGYVHDHTVEATSIGIATLTSDTWGLKFTGNTPMTFNPITETYGVSTFNVLGGDLGTEYKSIKSHRGVGTYREVVSMENLHQGEDRHYYADSMTTRREFTAEPGKYYDMLTINLRNQNHSSPATGIAEYNYATLVLAIDHSLSYETLNTAFGLTAITLT